MKKSKLVKLMCGVGLLLPCVLLGDEANASGESSTKAESSTKKDSKSGNKIVLGVYGGLSMLKVDNEYEVRSTANSNRWEDIPGNYDKTLGGFSWGGKLGYDLYFLPRHGLRIYADYMNTLLDSKEGTLGKINLHTIGVNLDYKFEIIAGLGIFAGAGAVYNILNTQYLGSNNYFGGSLNAGLSYQIWLFEIELRVRYLIYDTKETRSSYIPNDVKALANGATDANIWHNVHTETPLSFHLGVNFRF